MSSTARHFLAPLPVLLAFGSGHAVAQEARVWLDRMNQAVEELNYQGTFVHVLDGNAESLFIVHRNADGQSAERLLSLDGPGREIVRTGDEVQCILPDQRVVLLETRNVLSPLVSALPTTSTELEPHYAIALGENRESQIDQLKRSLSSRGTSFATDTGFGSTVKLRCR